MDLRYVDPRSIGIPDVRLTSEMDAEDLAMFRESIHESGLLEPVLAIEEDGKLMLVNGLHRLEAALHERLTEVPVVVKAGTLRDVLLENLQTSRLHGRPKASQVRKVIRALEEEYDLDSDQLVAKTGLSREYVEQLMWVNRACSEVQEALDQDAIKVGHAYELARVEDQDDQERMLGFIISGRISVENTRLMLREYRRAKADASQEEAAPAARVLGPVRCQGCGQMHEVNALHSIILCVICTASLIQAVRIVDAPPAPDIDS